MARFAIASSAVLLAACSGLLGLTDPTLDNTLGDGGGSSGGDAAPVGDGGPTTGDGSTSKDGAPPTCTANLTNDKNNCGACGHSCLGGECAASECQPVLVVGDETHLSPYDLEINTTDNFIYFTNVGVGGSDIETISRIAKSAVNATSATTFLDLSTVGSHAYAYEVATVGTNLYYATHDDFQTGQVAGCTIGTSTVTCSGNAITNIDAYGVAVDNANHVVFAADFNPSDGGDTLYSMRKSTIPNLSPTTDLFSDVGSEINWVKIDGPTAYFANPFGVYSCPLTGCVNPQHLTPTSPEAEEIGIANGIVYFTSTNPTNGVYSVPESGGTITPIVVSTGTAKLTYPFAVVADSKYVYFTDNGDESSNTLVGKVARCPIAGCGTSEYDISNGLAAGGNPRGITQDDAAVYWGTADGEIWKVAKPAP